MTKVIFTNGCFDVLHLGHVRLLEFCKSLGGRVVVGVNSDASVKRLKGSMRPINRQEARCEVLSSIKFVDEVILFDEDTPLTLIQQIKPDIVVKGGDYKQEDVVGYGLAEVVIFNFIDGYSSTSIINKKGLEK